MYPGCARGVHMETRSYVLTKKIAKHGSQSIVIIPKVLRDELPPNTLVKLTIDVLKEGC